MVALGAMIAYIYSHNLPLALLETLIDAPVKRSEANRPLAVGIDSRSRGFRPPLLVKRIKELREGGGRDVQTLFLDCAGTELERRFSETRRRHPMAEDRPAADGIAREREMMEPLRRWAEHVIDTTNYTSNDLQQEVRHRFGDAGDDEPALGEWLSARGVQAVLIRPDRYVLGVAHAAAELPALLDALPTAAAQ